MSGDLEIATRLRAFLPKGLLQYWPIQLWGVPVMPQYRANNLQRPMKDRVTEGEVFGARPSTNGQYKKPVYR
jgi:hypothetical protein